MKREASNKWVLMNILMRKGRVNRVAGSTVAREWRWVRVCEDGL